MKVIYNNLIPFPGYAAINLFGILFVRKGCNVTEQMINHEAIHTAQMKEMLYVPFYLWYVVEWFVRLIKERWTGKGDAYKDICFEKEAYQNEDNLEYLEQRKFWNFIKYLKNKEK